ncbi:DNA sulfur modification protein DndE [Oleidesulfovibrio alaskensis]|uniref:DNA sulfur modification protein DndE n=1 Tax=Oleidesulfovibrio alaskensis TaxID=58180 RepID=UPI001A3B1678|nr:DNA sulfur modification protein DndE [Oleidesulfovibrio alaskensis]MBL3582644.1 DNA sulfur modification protein DndE [Oleidesulfovibrio alaskensis]
MEALTIQRVPFTKDADNKLRALKARTGITPNILCRIGFCMSLEVPTEPADVSDVEKGREINRFTLFGEFEPCFVALLTVWKQQQGSTRSLDELLVLHMNRGAVMVSQSRVL